MTSRSPTGRRTGDAAFEELLTEGATVPVEGWDFSWFVGRATEERPPWGYHRLLDDRMSRATAALDLETGGGEVLAGISRPPALLVATESWPPNVAVARRNLRRVGGTVVATGTSRLLPFRDASVDLVVSRHPVHTPWPEIARVLAPGGRFLSQQIGAGTLGELAEAVRGVPQDGPPRSDQQTGPAVAAAEAAGLRVVDLRQATLRVAFHDIAAVVHLLRKVVWTVPDFSVERYRPQLARLHERIVAEGEFVAYARRFLIEAVRPE
ncbi:class I SAM-dependent methyltransferase [Micromonospora echinofusca]|uniref:Methyltransferase domain-containing protein n=1 Tax=Micromonospora echinofusca TaxID=47858 RepID=A0ABS3VV43_MICEH|nr:class I SAM-dependent methyltransferase [Micromonospora echinofusca]MBO4208264.1 methyltransferase domain-containing protein [Micromonospora echinofusca]